jgi:Domain of unknown function (DUF4440)
MVFLSTVLVLAQTTTAVQKDLTALYMKWDKAVVAHDKKVMESIIANNFFAKIKGSKKTMNKQEFIGAITASWSKKDSPKEQSFTTKITKVMPVKTRFAALVAESMVFKLKDGSTRKVDFKSLDVWEKVGATWQIVQTEPMDK